MLPSRMTAKVRYSDVYDLLDGEQQQHLDALYRQRLNNTFIDDRYDPPEKRWRFVVADGVVESARCSFSAQNDAYRVLAEMHSPTLHPAANVIVAAAVSVGKCGVLLFNTRQNYRFECCVPDTFDEIEGDWVHADGVLGLRTSHIHKLTLKECKIMTNTY